VNIGTPSGEGSQDFDLNLASIIDCFTVLITFMLASASFLSIGILDAGVAAAGAAAAPGTPPPVTVTVELAKDNGLAVKVAGKATSTSRHPAREGKWDHEGMTRSLADVKARFPGVTAVTVSADSAVEYRHVVTTMEAARKTLPVVLLGGF
jgi:biopolymer transport protein ExbD